MKLYHYALFFAVVVFGFFMTAYISLVLKMQDESNKKTEYDCLVAAVEAAADVVFEGNGDHVTEYDLAQAEEAFFQTLEVLWYGTADWTTQDSLKRRVPCIVVFSEDGYYRYCFKTENGYGWSEQMTSEQGKVPRCFFEETEKLLTEYHEIRYTSSRKYRIEQAARGVWEQGISPPCVFAVYAPVHSELSTDGRGFVYAASGHRQSVYYVTEDNRCHFPSCSEYKNGNVVACYATQRESAEEGAIPCEKCMR